VTVDDVFRALGDPTRREVLRLLRESGSMTAGEISTHFDLAKSTMSAHFNALRQAGLIVSERQGQRIVYSLHQSVVEEAVEAMLRLLRVGGPSSSEKRGDSQ
jgi:DNA-binding transcriptional ArsR family regulator